jgi:arsenate reductase
MKLLEHSRNLVRRFSQEVEFYKRVIRHPRTPRVSKVLLGVAIAYAVSPIDLIPDFIPVIGYLDDLLILPLLIWIAVRLIPKSVIIECRQINMAETKKRVLFLCTHNSARSQMAEGLLRALSNSSVDVFSAGTVVTSVRPEAITVMQEVGINIRGQESKTLERYRDEPFDLVITVCDSASEACPIFPNAQERWHWSMDDPSQVEGAEAKRLNAFRRARDELRRRIEATILEKGAAADA